MVEKYGKYVMYVTDIYLPCIDTERGDFRFLPFEGDALDQPYMSMQVIKLIQLNYRKYLDKQMKKITAKGRR